MAGGGLNAAAFMKPVLKQMPRQFPFRILCYVLLKVEKAGGWHRLRNETWAAQEVLQWSSFWCNGF